MQLKTVDILNFREDETRSGIQIKSFVKQEGLLPGSKIINSKFSSGLPSGLRSKEISPKYEDGGQIKEFDPFQKQDSLRSSNE